ncbi:Dopey, N-terminal-domain-containing protein [Mycena galericulata]|nr:Dopey, N-terminal-domain-containing protein [Mycena galericulata]
MAFGEEQRTRFVQPLAPHESSSHSRGKAAAQQAFAADPKYKKYTQQCLNPALPTGVHQRALDVYSHILAVLGSFILALLPGLEEETGEFFEKVLSLLDRLSGTVSPAFFFQNIWLVMLTTPSARGTALNLLARRLPRLNAEEDITAIIGRDIGLMIRAFAAALEDDNLLVRRGALDLLLQTTRVDSAAIRKAQSDDRTILMRAAISVVLRRDLSLNRRLYTWLLGPDENSEHQMAYLREHALDLLQSTLKDEMIAPSGEYAESRPFKIFISLLDKWEIGAPLTETLVFDSFKAIKQLIEAENGAEDVKLTASTLYEAVEPPVLWKQLLSAVFDELTGMERGLKSVSYLCG